MDLIRLLRSLEEFLYELVGWLVFYPRTFWRILLHPGAIAVYTKGELAKNRELQFQDTISPVLMLILSVALAHAIELICRVSIADSDTPMGKLMLGSEQGLLLTRSAVFCIYALGAALSTLWLGGQTVTRETLREPFSIQAFLVCPFVILTAVGQQLLRVDTMHWAGIAVTAAGVAWYILARTIAYRTLYKSSWLRALTLVCVWFAGTTVATSLLLAMLILP